MEKLNLAIVVTGVIGSGKSSVCKLLELYGYKIISADEISHKILDRCVGEAVEIFGDDVLSDGKIDRKKIGIKVFGNPDLKLKLEQMLHPKIEQEIYDISAKLEQGKNIYFLDIPLFFEVGGREKYNVSKVLLISATKELCIERIVKRDGISKELAMKKFDSQISIEKKKNLSDFVIENSGSLKDLQNELDGFLSQLKETMCQL